MGVRDLVQVLYKEILKKTGAEPYDSAPLFPAGLAYHPPGSLPLSCHRCAAIAVVVMGSCAPPRIGPHLSSSSCWVCPCLALRYCLIALSLHCLVLALPCPHVALSPCPPSSRHLALHHLVILPSVILPLCLLLIWPVLSLLISPPLSFLVNILSLLFLLLLVIVLFPFLVIIIVVSSVPPLIWLHLIIVTLWSCLVLVAGSQASVRGIGRGRSEMSHDKGRGSYFITHQWRILPHLPPSPDPPSSKAGHRSRSLWVTCGFTYRNTCRDPDLQVQVTCGYRSLRIWV